MKYLLDTHSLIWYLEDMPNLSLSMRGEINNEANDIYICAASLLKITIKVNSGKLKLTSGLDEFLDNMESGKFGILQVEDRYLRKFVELPLLHKDPFDRMIIATAIVDKLTIITVDENIRKYDVSWAW